MEDSSGDSDDDASIHSPAATPAGHASPTEAGTAVTTTTAAAAAPPPVDSSSVSSGPHPERSSSRSRACVIGVLPPDLLLQCAEYLGDARSLCRVREVCLSWVVTLDDREAGQRLWRPLFYRLRASGSIHKATDTTGQQHRQLKVYDLGTTATAAAVATPPNNRSAALTAAATGVSTPSPNPNPGGASFSARKSPGPSAQASACMVCGLIQREAYSGRECEMCASPLVLVQNREAPAPATPRLAYTRVNLSGGGIAPAPSKLPPFSSPSQQQQQQQRKPGAGSGSGPSALVGRSPGYSRGGDTTDRDDHTVSESAGAGAGAGAARGGAVGSSSGAHGREEREQEQGLGEGARSIDWHFLVKRLAEEKRIAGAWGSLHHGWVWLQRALQVRGETWRVGTCSHQLIGSEGCFYVCRLQADQ